MAKQQRAMAIQQQAASMQAQAQQYKYPVLFLGDVTSDDVVNLRYLRHLLRRREVNTG